ncbi:MAG: DNA/RNA non-specific endonuclease [Alistipes sp.]|nr:DNA/RNA non-specific endonuclease [Alistipes sp.]
MKRIFHLCTVLLALSYASCSLIDDGNEAPATYLTVTPAEITFHADGNNSFTVDTDGDWVVTAISDKVSLSEKMGTKGKTTVTILAMTGTTPQTVVIRTPSNPALIGKITIKPDDGSGGGGDDNGDNGDDPTPVPSVTLYYDNLDGDPTYTNWANNSASWQNPTGEGANEVSYNSAYTKLRNDNYGSANKYTGASGNSYIRIYEPSGSTSNFVEVLNIATNGEKDFTFSFGAAFQASQCALYIKGDDSSWKRLEYTASSAYNTWTLAEASFSLVGNVEKLGFRFEPTDANVSYGYNIDDLRLATSKGGQTIEIGSSANYAWAEMPEKRNSKTEYLYKTHWSNTVKSNKRVRNYSYCYDTRRHSPMWIAHPHHAIYQEGGYTRPATDPWACDPYLTNEQSAIIYPIDGNICSLRTYFDDTYYQWGRGHMLASSYRGCGNASNPAEINVQTFYSSNVAAQRSGNCAFQMLWGAAERKIQDNYICADTLYVVSGAHFANEKTTATDANMFSLSSLCKTCIVPTHFYKIVLRTKSGSTGKAIQECSASELKAVGFWFSNTDTDEQTGSTTPTLSKAHMRSVAEIERLTGNEFDFFPGIPDEVKQSFNASEWGF